MQWPTTVFPLFPTLQGLIKKRAPPYPHAISTSDICSSYSPYISSKYKPQALGNFLKSESTNDYSCDDDNLIDFWCKPQLHFLLSNTALAKINRYKAKVIINNSK
jgi:hypothetical protein